MPLKSDPPSELGAKAHQLATEAPIDGLAPSQCHWLYECHESLARALHAAQSPATSPIAQEPTIVVDALPESTRQYLWRGIRAHHPALAAWLRGAPFRAMRETFNAQLHLYARDMIQVIGAAGEWPGEPPLGRSIGHEANV